MLPSIDYNEGGQYLRSFITPAVHANQTFLELTCIMEHINTRKESHEGFENEREIDVGTAKANCLPLGKDIFRSYEVRRHQLTVSVVWTRARGAIQSHPDRPLIVIISRRTDGISSKITSHYSNDRYKRWDRIAKNQAWVYLDLYFLFTKWDRIWGAVKQNLQRRTEVGLSTSSRERRGIC
jgi:acyl carrier protein phosphodiesterase